MPKGKTYGNMASGKRYLNLKKENKANYDNLGSGWQFLLSIARWYPDFLCDVCLAEDAEFDLTIIQRVIMRAKARNKYCSVTGCRGLTKTYCTFLEEMVEMLCYPGIQISYYGPSMRQTADICSKIYKTSIMRNYPALASHFIITSDAKDKFEIKTQFGSCLSVTSFRGNTVHKVVVEEAAQEEAPQFDWNEYRRVVLPTVRGRYRVLGKDDPYYIPYKQHMITSAGRRQNDAYQTRCIYETKMKRGESSFVMDVPYDVVLLSQIRDVQWAESSRSILTPDEWAREMESRYSGGDSNPVIPDRTLTECRCLTTMEEHHCCKDYNNKLDPRDVFYIVCYDVSYADGAINAKCACVVLKCTKQKEFLKRDKYLKQVVWVDDWEPKPPMEQAQKLKQIWYRYCYEGHPAYITIDCWQYGSAVAQALMMDLGDGLAPLCTWKHTLYAEYELENALEIIYPIKAGGVGTTDPDAEMIRNAEVQFDNHNVELLIADYETGIEEYKKIHRIKDDSYNYAIYNPYKKTNELVTQIENLKKVVSASGVSEKRISQRIQRDSWSALKYGLRFAQILEREYLVKANRPSEWEKELKKYEGAGKQSAPVATRSRIPFERKGGRFIG